MYEYVYEYGSLNDEDESGPEVSEQIGAQIFIDAFGMVAPGRPELAVKLAGRAARVSHDGEADNLVACACACSRPALRTYFFGRPVSADAPLALYPGQVLVWHAAP